MKLIMVILIIYKIKTAYLVPVKFEKYNPDVDQPPFDQYVNKESPDVDHFPFSDRYVNIEYNPDVDQSTIDRYVNNKYSPDLAQPPFYGYKNQNTVKPSYGYKNHPDSAQPNYKDVYEIDRNINSPSNNTYYIKIYSDKAPGHFSRLVPPVPPMPSMPIHFGFPFQNNSM